MRGGRGVVCSVGAGGLQSAGGSYGKEEPVPLGMGMGWWDLD